MKNRTTAFVLKDSGGSFIQAKLSGYDEAVNAKRSPGGTYQIEAQAPNALPADGGWKQWLSVSAMGAGILSFR